jgi:hypothetical protein
MRMLTFGWTICFLITSSDKVLAFICKWLPPHLFGRYCASRFSVEAKHHLSSDDV